MIPRSDITDQARGEFLRKLDDSDLLVSDWEARFIASFLSCHRDWQFWTDPRRVAADKMRLKYGHEREIAMPLLGDAQRAPIPAAEPAGCQFLVREDGRQCPCNAPAAFRRQNGFRYCEDHAEAVLRDLKRRGQTMHLIPFKQ